MNVAHGSRANRKLSRLTISPVIMFDMLERYIDLKPMIIAYYNHLKRTLKLCTHSPLSDDCDSLDNFIVCGLE